MKDIDKKWLEKWETVKEKTGKIYSEEYRQRFGHNALYVYFFDYFGIHCKRFVNCSGSS